MSCLRWSVARTSASLSRSLETARGLPCRESWFCSCTFRFVYIVTIVYFFRGGLRCHSWRFNQDVGSFVCSISSCTRTYENRCYMCLLRTTYIQLQGYHPGTTFAVSDIHTLSSHQDTINKINRNLSYHEGNKPYGDLLATKLSLAVGRHFVASRRFPLWAVRVATSTA